MVTKNGYRMTSVESCYLLIMILAKSDLIEIEEFGEVLNPVDWDALLEEAKKEDKAERKKQHKRHKKLHRKYEKFMKPIRDANAKPTSLIR